MSWSAFQTLSAQTTSTIGTGTSSSSARGPIQRSDVNSSTVFSRWAQVFTAAELDAVGITSGTFVTQTNWELASSNVIIGSGDANIKIYVRNTEATEATPDTWDNYLVGASLVYDEDFNTTNNFPGENGWMPFVFNSPVEYTGGAFEVLVEWDCSQVSTPAFSGDGSLKWRWSSTSPEVLVAKKTGSSSLPSTLSDTSEDRANIQFVTTSNPGVISSLATIGTGTSSSSARGPIQRSDVNSTSVFSRFLHVYTAAELAEAGLSSGVSINQLNWELASSNVVIGTGDATFKIYVRNTGATEAVADTWVNYTNGSTLVYDEIFNTTNNFPGANGWMPFEFDAPFEYTGGALEIAVDWDCSQVSTPAFSGDGSLKWRWETVAPNTLIAKKTSSSSPPSTLSDLSQDRANIQIAFSTSASTCNAPSNLTASNVTESAADLSWSSSDDATAYNWIIVAAGDGEEGTAVDSGSSSSTSASTSALSSLTSYDLYVQSDCGGTETSNFAGPFTFATAGEAPLVTTIGTGTSSSSTRGPFQRSDTASSTVFSRFAQTYTAVELANAGVTNGSIISSVNWELASSNVIIGDGNANLKIYVRNTSATEAVADSWVNTIEGSELVFDTDFNVNNNFPGANGWMEFNFSTPFTYTGGALEIAVDWDCSQVSTPAFSGDGSIKWRWESTAPDFLVAKKTASSSPPSTLSDLRDERANIQIVFTEGNTEVTGCTDCSAENYNPEATSDDGSCVFSENCKGDFNDDGQITASDLTAFLSVFGLGCSE